MRARVRGRSGFFRREDGRVITYPVEKIYEEAAFIAYHFHWSHDHIMELEHRDRRRWCEEISKINRSLNDEPEKNNPFDVFGKR